MILPKEISFVFSHRSLNPHNDSREAVYNRLVPQSEADVRLNIEDAVEADEELEEIDLNNDNVEWMQIARHGPEDIRAQIDQLG
ncbi:hypothetical protein RUM43_012472 [Polyplax serrata]|uniref:Uncharacterized protein n=1 Tax=Polyplax serrata TaxID=468196 RepID=A0AAN8NKR8_POLSC